MESDLSGLSDSALLELVARGSLPGGAAEGEASPERYASAVAEALARMRCVRRASEVPSLRCSAEAYRVLGRSLARRTHERFLVVALDARNRPISRHLVAQGSLASCMVHPREIFAPLVRRHAAAAILVHNHPSGDPTPSPEDERLTERLVEAGRLLGIPVLDHLIVARHGYCSFRDAGRIGQERPGEPDRRAKPPAESVFRPVAVDFPAPPD